MPRRSIQSLIHLIQAPTAAGFAVRLLLLWPLITGLAAVGPVRRVLEAPLTVFYAATLSRLFSWFSVDHTREGAELIFTGRGFTFLVDAVCTGYFVFWFFVGAVLAFPASWVSRAKAIASGAVFLFVLNVVRILSLYPVRIEWPDLFDEIHLVVWQSLVVISVGVFWYGWASTRPSDSAVTPE